MGANPGHKIVSSKFTKVKEESNEEGGEQEDN